MSNDVLRQYPEKQVHGWYERLARNFDVQAARKGLPNPMSGKFLLQYLGKNNNSLGAPLELDAPEHLKTDDSVTAVQAFHRAVFLTEKKASFEPAPERWAGLIPRLQSKTWDGNSTISLTYASLSDVAPNRPAVAWQYSTRPTRKWDIFTSLRGWQLKSSVQIAGTSGDKVAVTFVQWNASGEDYYDFDPKEHLTLPNPDYQSKDSAAIAPKDADITVYHTNAIRLEKVGLAQPFKVIIRQWLVQDPRLLAPAEIDPKKDLT